MSINFVTLSELGKLRFIYYNVACPLYRSIWYNTTKHIEKSTQTARYNARTHLFYLNDGARVLILAFMHGFLSPDDFIMTEYSTCTRLHVSVEIRVPILKLRITVRNVLDAVIDLLIVRAQ